MDSNKQLLVAFGLGVLSVIVAHVLLQSYDAQAQSSVFFKPRSMQHFDISVDNNWQDCQGSKYKRGFPDLDYSLYGYDILNGYPMTTGRDPGFTHPIFKADYTSSKQTSDCRYSLPQGVNAMPSESCVVSFESRLLRNKEEMDASLSAQAQTSGGVWGFHFSASAAYKSNRAKMSAGENFFIVSQAKCEHYFTEIDFSNPPPFDPGFLIWTDNLTASGVPDESLGKFVKYYGTHFLADVTFGAKFIQQHKMSQSTYSNYQNSEISIETQANYAGLISVGAGFSLTEEQRNAATQFSKDVETSTITVGSAPPSNGDAMTWAASAQNNPLPTRYTLMPIDVLFSEFFKAVLPKPIDVYAKLKAKLSQAVATHCEQLKSESKIPSCEGATQIESSGIIFDPSLKAGYKWLRDVDEFTCKTVCLEDDKCIAVQYTRSCESPQDACTDDRWVCRLIGEEQELWEMSAAAHTSKLVIFVSKLQFTNKTSLFIERAFLNAETAPVATTSISQCEESCKHIAHCDAITYTNEDCSMFSMSQNPFFVHDSIGTTVVMVKDMNSKITR